MQPACMCHQLASVSRVRGNAWPPDYPLPAAIDPEPGCLRALRNRETPALFPFPQSPPPRRMRSKPPRPGFGLYRSGMIVMARKICFPGGRMHKRPAGSKKEDNPEVKPRGGGCPGRRAGNIRLFTRVSPAIVSRIFSQKYRVIGQKGPFDPPGPGRCPHRRQILRHLHCRSPSVAR